MKKSSIKFLVFFIAIMQFICAANAQKIPDERIKELLVGSWTSGNETVAFNKDGKFDEGNATYLIKNLIDCLEDIKFLHFPLKSALFSGYFPGLKTAFPLTWNLQWDCFWPQ